MKGPGAVEDVSVVRFEPGGIDFLRAVRLVVNVQQIVNAYQYREDVGIDLQRVLLPAGLQVRHAVAADAPVVEPVVLLGIVCHIAGGTDEHVTVSENVVHVGEAAVRAAAHFAPVAVRHGISDIKDFFSGCVGFRKGPHQQGK